MTGGERQYGLSKGNANPIQVERDGPFAVVTIDAAARLVDDAFLAAVEAVCAAIHDNDAIHVALLSGPFVLASDAAPVPGRLAFRCIETTAQPVIAVIDGAASGAGLELALACDMRVASEEATFSMDLDGLMPLFGGTQRLPRVAGAGIAARMLLLGETLPAADALRCGLVNAVAAEPEDAARAIATTIASRGPLAVRYAKEAVVRGAAMPLEQALRYETDLTVILQTTADRAEGVRAFLDKRPPRFEGR